MKLEIDPLSEVPLYQQLRDRVVEGIAGGELAPGASLASVRQVAVEFGINVATVAKGYDLLRAEGLIRTHRTSGSVVARGPRSGSEAERWSGADAWRARLRTLLAEGIAQGMRDADIVRAATAVLADFGLTRDAADRPGSTDGPEGSESPGPVVPRAGVRSSVGPARPPRGALA